MLWYEWHRRCGMIEAIVMRNEELLMQRFFYDPDLTLIKVLHNLELYVINEQLNTVGECVLRVRFGDLRGS